MTSVAMQTLLALYLRFLRMDFQVDDCCRCIAVSRSRVTVGGKTRFQSCPTIVWQVSRRVLGPIARTVRWLRIAPS
jgi:hypothetical protein